MDYFKILKVKRDASREEVKKAYRKFAFHFHPDMEKGNEELFLIVHEAYEALMKLFDEEEAKESPLRMKPARHNLSFVRGYVRRSEVWAPDFHLVRRPKISVESNLCPACNGFGVLPNKLNLTVRCPKCGGSGLKTKIIIEPPA